MPEINGGVKNIIRKHVAIMILKVPMYQTIKVYPFTETPRALLIPFVAHKIAAGFPSPANDYLETRIDLNEELIKNPSSTFFARISGLSMQGAGIEENDIVVIDKSLQPRDGCIAVCCLDGEFTLKRIKIKTNCVWLVPENDDFQPIVVTEDNELIIWGIVTFIIKKT
jgi:DNA polymerase V